MKTKTAIINTVLTALLCFATFAFGEGLQEQLNSPLAAQTFYDAGYELYTAKDANASDTMQAVAFLNAAINLDSRANYVLEDLINIAWQYPDKNFSDAVRLSLDQYIDRSTDLEISSKAIGYLLEKLDSREQRENLLLEMSHKMANKNDMFTSDLLAQLGFLKAETADTNDAQKYLMQAFSINKYNRLAFAKLAELIEGSGYALPDIAYLENLRYAVRLNPTDFESAFSFAKYCQAIGLYAPAAAGYGYCAEMSKSMQGKISPDAELCRPWILSCYNSAQYGICGEILKNLRASGIIDVRVEAIAATAANQAGDKATTQAILNGLEARSQKILAGEIKATPAELTDYAWMFSFAIDSNSQDDLAWATKAYDADANSIEAASLFAYALVKNQQADIAKPLLEKLGTSAPAAAIAQAEIAIQNNDSNSAIDLFKNVVAAAPGSFESARAVKRLKELGSEYVSPINANAMTKVLTDEFGTTLFGTFIPPEKSIKLTFNIKGAAFSYGGEIRGTLAIINNNTEPMFVCPDAMVKGNIRIDARIAGDVTEQIPALIEKRVRPSYEIKPGNALFIPVRLDTGRVKQILDSHPQAELNIEFTAYVDPQKNPDGSISNLLKAEPGKVIIKRRKLELNTQYLQQKLDAIKKGHQGQKVQSAQLFAGLLAEQQKMRQTGIKYKFMYAEPELLTSALARCMVDSDWVLKVQAIAAMHNLRLDYRLTQAVSQELQNRYWPVRFMALYVLAKNQPNFAPVITWTIQNDPDALVKQLATVLSGDNSFGTPEPKQNSADSAEPNLPALSKAEGPAISSTESSAEVPPAAASPEFTEGNTVDVPSSSDINEPNLQ